MPSVGYLAAAFHFITTLEQNARVLPSRPLQVPLVERRKASGCYQEESRIIFDNHSLYSN